MISSNINLAPQPSFKDIFGVLRNSNQNCQLKNLFSINDFQFFCFSQSAWALFAIAKCRAEVFSNSAINIWIPDYFCNSSLIPLKSLGFNIFFYPISIDRTPKLQECRNMLNKNIPDIILFVNYFGQKLFSQGLFEIAKENKAWLVEDSAHCIEPISLDHCSDFVMYSPHKLFPIPDGSVLIVRDDGPNSISNEVSSNLFKIYNSLNKKILKTDLRAYKWLFKRVFQKLGANRVSNSSFDNENSPSELRQFNKPAMSFLANQLLKNSIDIKSESRIRKSNYNEWKKILNINNLDSKIEFSAINYVPYLAEARVLDKKQAKKIYTTFQKANIPVTTWPDLPPQVLNDPLKHKVAIEMRFNRIFFPVHSSVNSELINSSFARVKN